MALASNSITQATGAHPTKAREMMIMTMTRNLPGIEIGVMSPYLSRAQACPGRPGCLVRRADCRGLRHDIIMMKHPRRTDVIASSVCQVQRPDAATPDAEPAWF
jgi:hypothetical protein